MRPSGPFERNCWISCEPIENNIAVLADCIGPQKIMWATDYLHQDGVSLGAPAILWERLKSMPKELEHQVMAGVALGF